MATIKDKVENILDEKNNKIIPENIKKDVTIFDVTGSYESSGSNLNEYFNLTLTDNNKSILKKIPELDTSNLYNFSSLFEGIGITKLPDNLDFSTATHMSSMVANCENLIELPDVINSVNCYNFDSMFMSCRLLTDISNTIIDVKTGDSDYQSVWIYLSNMFLYCYKLTKSPIFRVNPNNYNLNIYLSMNNMFGDCYDLVTINQILPNNIPESWNIQIDNMEQILDRAYNLSYNSILQILDLLQYTSNLSSSSKVLLSIGLYWRLIEKILPEDIVTYVTNNNWITGLENMDTYTIDNKLYDMDGNVLYSNIEELIGNLGIDDYLRYEESTVCNPSNGFQQYYTSHHYDYSLQKDVCTSKLVKYDDLLNIKGNAFDYNCFYMVVYSMLSNNNFYEVCKIHYEYVTEDEKINKILKFRTTNIIFKLDLTEELVTKLNNLDFNPLFSLDLVYYNSRDVEMQTTYSITISSSVYKNLNDKHKFIASISSNNTENYDKIKVVLDVYKPIEPSDIDGAYAFSTTCTIDDDNLPYNKPKVYSITCDV